MKIIDMLQSAGVAASATLLVLAAGALATHEAHGAELPAQDVTLRNVQILDTARESWAVATAVNSSGMVLEEPIIILELEDGTEVRHVGPARVEPGDAWRIVERIHGEAVSGFAQGERQ
ncbi:hypothetical protein [Azotobacter vinelandii]|uniref:hypothetical protein n=1 Tax=Azotobacter vinelandii TaxID=354 RepID=UPI00266515BC|nr:hypothetical protein [Azotobacter vinelandii]WKN20852.1 hypothetical protein AVAEIV_003878 [Azotobacter vinelandii]